MFEDKEDVNQLNHVCIDHPLLSRRLTIYGRPTILENIVNTLFSMFEISTAKKTATFSFRIDDRTDGKLNLFFPDIGTFHCDTINQAYGIISRICFGGFKTYNWFYIHGGALNYEGKTVLIIGPTGAGKSTMIANLCNEKGFFYLSDDVIPVHICDLTTASFPKPIFLRKNTNVVKLSPKIRVIQDAIILDNDVRHVGIPKYFINVKQKTQVSAIIILKRSNLNSLGLRLLKQHEAFLKIMLNAFESEDIDISQSTAYRMASTIPMFELTYSESSMCGSLIKSAISN